jgi:hypothetical protein
MGRPAVGFSGQVPSRSSEGEQALRARVNEFYSLLQANNWSQAEKYITQDSLEVFRNLPKTPFLGFQIDSIKLSPDGQSAQVIVRVQVMTAYAPTPVPFPRTSNWRLIGGVWQAVASEIKGSRLQSEFSFPPIGQSAARRPPQSAKLKFESTEVIVDPIHVGEVREVRFRLKNLSNQVVKVGDVNTGSESLRLKSGKKEYRPGESGTLVFEWDPVHYDYGYALEDTIVLTTEPGGAVTLLMARTFVDAGTAAEKKSPPKE